MTLSAKIVYNGEERLGCIEAAVVHTRGGEFLTPYNKQTRAATRREVE